MKIRSLVLILCVPIGAFLLGCSANTQDLDLVQAPWVDFECDPAQSTACTNTGDGKTVYMGLSSVSGFDCEQELAALPSTLFTASFDYSGQTTASFNGTYLEGIISYWVNSSGAKSINMVDREYVVCAFLDVNNNGELDIDEPLTQDSIDPSENFLPLTQWVQL